MVFLLSNRIGPSYEIFDQSDKLCVQVRVALGFAFTRYGLSARP
jgi:hypothetical protein